MSYNDIVTSAQLSSDGTWGYDARKSRTGHTQYLCSYVTSARPSPITLLIFSLDRPRHRVARHHGCVDALTYLSDLDRNLTLAEVRIALQRTDVQVAMQRLRVLEKRVSRIHAVISRTLLRQERILLSLGAIATGERSVSAAGCAFVMFVILLAWAVAAVREKHLCS